MSSAADSECITPTHIAHLGKPSGEAPIKSLQKFSQERWLDMGMATLTFTVHTDEEGRSIGDV